MVSLLAAAAIQLPLSHPVQGGHLQVALGLKERPYEVLSLYNTAVEERNKFGDPISFYEQRLGYVAVRVRKTVFNSEETWLFETDARLKDPKKESSVGTEFTEQSWVGLDGKLHRQIFTVEIRGERRKVDVIFGTKTVEISSTQNGKEQQATLYPEDGTTKAFDMRFSPMIVDGKITVREKDFLLVDPYTLGYKKAKAFVSGRFEGEQLQTRFKGPVITIQVGNELHKAMISEEGDLPKVELPNETYLRIDSLPNSRLRGSGGGGRR